mgnify:CR=1 FL=1
MISYAPLAATLVKKKKKRVDMIRDGVITRGTSTKFAKSEYTTLQTLDRVCQYLGCQIQDVVEILPDTPASD